MHFRQTPELACQPILPEVFHARCLENRVEIDSRPLHRPAGYLCLHTFLSRSFVCFRMNAIYCHQHLNLIKKEQIETRRQIKFFRCPLTTLRLFAAVCIKFVQQTTTQLVLHPLTLYVAVPAIAFYVSGLEVGALQPWWDAFEANVKYAVWWFMLGVLSSIGLGTGMHSGLLFLFPHIIAISHAAQVCQNLDFSSRGDGTYMCIENAPQTGVSFWQLWLAVFPACWLWGSGTAAGEIPPYLLTRAARLAGESNGEFEDLEGEGDLEVVRQMKKWMIDVIEKYGFMAILLLAAWPNAAFDLCGMACGHFLMPFWTFFGATYIGKALIKVRMFFSTVSSVCFPAATA